MVLTLTPASKPFGINVGFVSQTDNIKVESVALKGGKGKSVLGAPSKGNPFKANPGPSPHKKLSPIYLIFSNTIVLLDTPVPIASF